MGSSKRKASSSGDRNKRSKVDKETSEAEPVVEKNTTIKKEEEKKPNNQVEVEEEEEEEEAPVEISWTGDTTQNDRSRSCPYLDTIDRKLLDFDFEKVCSVTLINQNVYACLVCGKYFQGRGRSTPAYTHSVTSDHHVFMNLETKKFYCLPDNYEVLDNSLADIKRVLDPSFEKSDVKLINTVSKTIRCLDGTSYEWGVMGLNNMKANDYVNVVIQSILRCNMFRDFFLFPNHYRKCQNPLVSRTGELVRKIWCKDNYKSHISPHELLQTVVNTSNKRFSITEQSDAIEFMAWYLNTLSLQLSKKKGTPNIVRESFQGKMVMTTRRLRAKELLNDAVEQEKAQAAEEAAEKVFDTTTKEVPFLYLTLDVPPPPLYVDAEKDDIIPQVPLLELFEKFDGEKEHQKGNLAHTYKIVKLPRYLVLYVKRFTKNNFFVEKNPTIVKFPVKNLDLKDHVFVPEGLSAKYDLIANVVHSGKPSMQNKKGEIQGEKGSYRTQVLQKVTGKWFEIEDLRISEISPQAISISEAYMQIYELIGK